MHPNSWLFVIEVYGYTQLYSVVVLCCQPESPPAQALEPAGPGEDTDISEKVTPFIVGIIIAVIIPHAQCTNSAQSSPSQEVRTES